MKKQLFLRLRNSGELSSEGTASIELTNIGNGTKTTLPVILFQSLPGAIRQIKIPLSRTLAPGRYSAVALIDYGKEHEELRLGQLDFTQN